MAYFETFRPLRALRQIRQALFQELILDLHIHHSAGQVLIVGTEVKVTVAAQTEDDALALTALPALERLVTSRADGVG